MSLQAGGGNPVDRHSPARDRIASDRRAPGGSWASSLPTHSAGPPRAAIAYLRELFGSPSALGPTMAGRAEQPIGDPAVTGASAAVLAADVIQTIGE